MKNNVAFCFCLSKLFFKQCQMKRGKRVMGTRKLRSGQQVNITHRCNHGIEFGVYSSTPASLDSVMAK